MKHLLLFVWVFLLAGCATNPSPATPLKVHYLCQRGAPVTVLYDNEEQIALLSLNNEVIRLPRQETASGFHYSNGKITLRGKENEILLTIGRMMPVQCYSDNASGQNVSR